MFNMHITYKKFPGNDFILNKHWKYFYYKKYIRNCFTIKGHSKNFYKRLGLKMIYYKIEFKIIYLLNILKIILC